MIDPKFVRSMQPGSSEFWTLISAAEPTPTDANGIEMKAPNYDARAVSNLRRIQAQFYAFIIGTIETRARQDDFGDAYRGALEARIDQLKLLASALPQYCWDKAGEMLERDRAHALTLFRPGEETEFYGAVCYSYLLRIAFRNAKPQRRRSGGGTARAGDTGMSTLLHQSIVRRVPMFGGLNHFLRYALAWVLADTAFVLYCAVTGVHEEKDIAYLDDDSVCQALANAPIWKPDNARRVALLATLAPATRRQVAGLVEEVNGQALPWLAEASEARKAQAQRADEALRQAYALQRELEQTRRERDLALRRHQAAMQDSIARTRLAQPDTADAAPPQLPPRDQDARTEERARQRRLAALEDQVALLSNDLKSLRAFTDSLLAPARQEEAVATPALDIGAARVVVVGGQHRLHQKLRRVLRNGVYISPDVGQLPAGAFPHADAVVFCVGYCPHNLSYSAAREVRRHGLRACYTSNTNPELVLEELRALLARTAGGADEPDIAVARCA